MNTAMASAIDPNIVKPELGPLKHLMASHSQPAPAASRLAAPPSSAVDKVDLEKVLLGGSKELSDEAKAKKKRDALIASILVGGGSGITAAAKAGGKGGLKLPSRLRLTPQSQRPAFSLANFLAALSRGGNV